MRAFLVRRNTESTFSALAHHLLDLVAKINGDLQ